MAAFVVSEPERRCPGPDILGVEVQRDLVADAHRAGLTSLTVVVLLHDEQGRLLLVQAGRTTDGLPQWTPPATDVLLGELLYDALDRLCRQMLHLDWSGCPTGFLWTTPIDHTGVMSYSFTLTIAESRPVLDDIGAHRWWNPGDTRPLRLTPAARQVLHHHYLLPPEPGDEQ